MARSLAESLIGTVDKARGLHAKFGLRPQRAFLVWVGWVAEWDPARPEPVLRPDMRPDSLAEAFDRLDLRADVVGVGRPVVLLEEEIVPVPLILLEGVGSDLDSVGATERGVVSVSQISARYQEEALVGLRHPFRDLANRASLKPGVDFFWELREARSRGDVVRGAESERGAHVELDVVRRRFHVVSVPTRDPSRFEWRLTLQLADGARGRGGEVDEVG